ncbi:MAG: response regulator [Lachnospiraceae bacterium]|nr:response regulator [Lachnospiraceae bacterium]
MLMKAMLVDDEPFILQGLSVLIDWETEGYEIVKKASDGQEALNYLRENKVDLIITDIRMPQINGLELLEIIRKEKISDAYIIILSGYNDFQYAQAALRYSCMDYILKPVQKEQLIVNIRRATADKENTVREEIDNKRMHRGYLLQNMTALLQGKIQEQGLTYIKEHFRHSEWLRYLHICLNDLSALEEMSDEEVAELKNRVYEQAVYYLQNDADHLFKDFFVYEEDYEIGFVYCDYMAKERGMDEEAFLQAFHRAAQSGSENMPVILLVGKRVNHISRLSRSYSSACVLRSFKGFQNHKNIYYYEKEVQVSEAKTILCKQPLDALVTAVDQNDTMAVCKSVDELFAELDRMDRTPDMVTVNLNWLIFRLINLAAEQDESVNQDEVLSYISSSVSKEEIVRGSRVHLRKFACEYAEYLVQLRKNASRGIIAKIENEVKERYAENLTLRELGQKYYINSSYLGQIFRKRYGQSFKNYLNNYRIREAASQLIRTDKKIGQIAEDVGYRDLDYFISRFIEQEGCTPSRYRKRAREEE